MATLPSIIASSTGFSENTEVPAAIGSPTAYGYYDTPIARWLGCPYQAVGTDGLVVGISAYHANDILEVRFQANGGPVTVVSEATFDERGVEGFWAKLVIDDSDLAASDGAQRELRATIIPAGPGTPVVYQGNNIIFSNTEEENQDVYNSEHGFWYCSTKEQATYLLDPSTDTFENALSVLLEQPGHDGVEWPAGSTQAPVILVDTDNLTDEVTFFADNTVLSRPYTNGLLTIQPARSGQRIGFTGGGPQRTAADAPTVADQGIGGNIKFVDCDFHWSTRISTEVNTTENPNNQSTPKRVYHFHGCNIDRGVEWYTDLAEDSGNRMGRFDAGLTGIAWFYDPAGDRTITSTQPDQEPISFLDNSSNLVKVVFENSNYTNFNTFDPVPGMTDLINCRLDNFVGDAISGLCGVFKTTITGQSQGLGGLSYHASYINAIQYDETADNENPARPTTRAYSTGDIIRTYYPVTETYVLARAKRPVLVDSNLFITSGSGNVSRFNNNFWETVNLVSDDPIWETSENVTGKNIIFADMDWGYQAALDVAAAGITNAGPSMVWKDPYVYNSAPPGGHGYHQIENIAYIRWNMFQSLPPAMSAVTSLNSDGNQLVTNFIMDGCVLRGAGQQKLTLMGDPGGTELGNNQTIPDQQWNDKYLNSFKYWPHAPINLQRNSTAIIRNCEFDNLELDLIVPTGSVYPREEIDPRVNVSGEQTPFLALWHMFGIKCTSNINHQRAWTLPKEDDDSYPPPDQAPAVGYIVGDNIKSPFPHRLGTIEITAEFDRSNFTTDETFQGTEQGNIFLSLNEVNKNRLGVRGNDDGISLYLGSEVWSSPRSGENDHKVGAIKFWFDSCDDADVFMDQNYYTRLEVTLGTYFDNDESSGEFSGACCVCDGETVTCTENVLESICNAAENANFVGPGTVCGDNPVSTCEDSIGGNCIVIGDPLGACCTDGECQEKTLLDCVQNGGNYAGDNVPCESVDCVLGSCCLCFTDDTSQCIINNVGDCDNLLALPNIKSTTWVDDGGSCTGCPSCEDPPEPIFGACCGECDSSNNRTCTQTEQIDCFGDWLGADTLCSSCDPCEVVEDPTGACCICNPVSGLVTCSVLTEGSCIIAGGEWNGPDTVCEENVTCSELECGDDAAVGACCKCTSGGGTQCERVTEAACSSIDGHYNGDGTICSIGVCDSLGCGDGDPSTVECDSNVEEGSAEVIHEVLVRNNSDDWSVAYNPPNITVSPGDTVRWIWESGVHPTISGTCGEPDELYFNETVSEENPVVDWVVPSDASGVIDYYCQFHCPLGMVGQISVVSGFRMGELEDPDPPFIKSNYWTTAIPVKVCDDGQINTSSVSFGYDVAQKLPANWHEVSNDLGPTIIKFQINAKTVSIVSKESGEGDYTTIQSAIDAASDGDTVLVRPGTYNEAINFKGKNIVVESTDGRDLTIINGSGAQADWSRPLTMPEKVSVVTVDTREPGTCYRSDCDAPIESDNLPEDRVLRGFTITGGAAGTRYPNTEPDCPSCSSRDEITTIGDNEGWLGGGIFVYRSALTIDSCIIRNNSSDGGGGMFARESRVVITNSKFNNNLSLSNGGGLQLNHSQEAIVTNCEFNANEVTVYTDNGFGRGGSIHVFGGKVLFEDCTVASSDCVGVKSGYQGFGGGMNIDLTAPPNNQYALLYQRDAEIKNCTFVTNSTPQSTESSGAGLRMNSNGSHITITDVIACNNSPDDMYPPLSESREVDDLDAPADQWFYRSGVCEDCGGSGTDCDCADCDTGLCQDSS